ncbi:signal-regulatory protein beta-2 [Fundulus heteroclitus]|uniref:signal-regulatory protein beta-2 n=1 Tax=Fundulus heteroclitus TaxID=8078 RepID=UPI00165B34E9|nr:signal-regulatory protein beta-2 [Fundulus heteroclitus]
MFWIRFTSGNWPEYLGQTITLDYDRITRNRHFTSKQENRTFILHIKEAQWNDTGLYYCIKVENLKLVFVNGTFLKVKGQQGGISASTQVPLSDPLYPGDPVTLQCSVLFDCKGTECPSDHRVFWFRAGSDESHPSVIDVDGKSGKECVRSLEAPKCVYSFSKNVSSSDTGTFYCAVATNEEIIFGNGTKLDVQEQSNLWKSKILLLLCVVVAACLVVIMCLIYILKKKTHDFCNDAVTGHGAQQKEQENSLVYCAQTFTRSKGGKAERRKVKVTHEETTYTRIKDFRIQ